MFALFKVLVAEFNAELYFNLFEKRKRYNHALKSAIALAVVFLNVNRM